MEIKTRFFLLLILIISSVFIGCAELDPNRKNGELNRFFALRVRASDTDPSLLWSTDGTQWTEVKVNGESFRTIGNASGNLVATLTGEYKFYSLSTILNNGTNWVKKDFEPGRTTSGHPYADLLNVKGTLIGVVTGAFSVFFYSEDSGKNFKTLRLGSLTQFKALAYDGKETLVAVGDNNGATTSSEGIAINSSGSPISDWSKPKDIFHSPTNRGFAIITNNYLDVTYSEVVGGFILIAEGGTLSYVSLDSFRASYDNLILTIKNPKSSSSLVFRDDTPANIPGMSIAAVASSDEKVVVVGHSGGSARIYHSSDAKTWEPATINSSAINNSRVELVDVTYGNGLFVAVGTLGAIVTSEDGISWEDSTHGSLNKVGGSKNFARVYYLEL